MWLICALTTGPLEMPDMHVSRLTCVGAHNPYQLQDPGPTPGQALLSEGNSCAKKMGTRVTA
jgi:hypothetical protein